MNLYEPWDLDATFAALAREGTTGAAAEESIRDEIAQILAEEIPRDLREALEETLGLLDERTGPSCPWVEPGLTLLFLRGVDEEMGGHCLEHPIPRLGSGWRGPPRPRERCPDHWDMGKAGNCRVRP